MKKLKLNLNKQAVIRLTSAEANTINGGGPTRSEARDGDCKYSRKHPVVLACDNHEIAIIGCYVPGGATN